MEDQDRASTATRTASTASNHASSDQSRRSNATSVSQIEKSVTHLLVATKQLLEILTQWSRGNATETAVSDVYVRLGYEFNIACRTFLTIGVDCKDLGPVPDLLRAILEETLSQEASQASLDRYLPRIRDIIINLLHGLKRKQQKLRQKSTRDVAAATPAATASRNSSRNTMESQGDSGSTAPPYHEDRDSRDSRTGSTHGSDHSSPSRQISRVDHEIDRASSILNHEAEQHRRYSRSPSEQPQQSPAQNKPQIPYPSDDTIPAPAEPTRPSRALDYGTPEPSLTETDALTALQHGGSLERRASRRFSHYQVQRQLGMSPAAMPMIPPTQHSPIPNRGRDPRQSVYANKVRMQANREPASVGESASDLQEPYSSQQASGSQDKVSSPSIPIIKTPENEQPAPNASSPEQERIRFSSNITTFSSDEPAGPDIASPTEEHDATAKVRDSAQPTRLQDGATDVELPESTTQLAGKPLQIFLQYKTRIKKLVLEGGYEELTMARLQLAFIEKFAWTSQGNGLDLPEIYIKDPSSDVRYELEDLLDVKNNSVLVLNLDELDEVKRHVDENMNSLKKLVEGVQVAINDQQAALQRVSERQYDAAKDMARFSLTPPTPPPTSNGLSTDASIGSAGITKNAAAKIAEVQTLRRELAVMRQTFSEGMSSMEAEMSTLRQKAAAVKTAASNTIKPSIEGAGGRDYVNSSKKTLNDDSEKIIGHVDDLQDKVEDLRKDVTRGVRPLPRQLDAVNKDIAAATEGLNKLKEFMAREKPIWQKVGEYELAAVMDDQNVIKLQEELATDLEDDLDKALQTFSLVQQASKQQTVTNGNAAAARSTSRTIQTGDVDPQTARDGVLGEVKALQPNHEDRLEAIARAEKARRLELESRREGEFKKELGSFVEEGRLKKSGGVEEVERLRKVRDEQIRRGVWEKPAPPPASGVAGTAEGATPRSEVPRLDLPVFDSSSLSADSAVEPGSASPEPEFVEASEVPAHTDLRS